MILRLFIAVDPSARQRQAVRLMQQRAAAYLEAVKWVNPEGMHLTVKFLGEVEEEKIPAIAGAMKHAAASAAPFCLQFKGAGVFPSIRRAAVIWIGLNAGTGPIKDLADGIDRELAGCGFSPEKREYIPHLTLGRLRRPQPASLIERFLDAEREFVTEKTTVDGLLLYRSNLTRQGAIYTVLKKILFE